ncbi:MAG: hypothetical protein PUB28_05280 [Roseburia sp.]|nr:hypothetical protein [Roseburia sp. 831b]MDD6216154.1 hypothetical protein [Roseburia sp.]MDY5882022.1 hypothetical protein [Roseburia sp.]WVK72253.1 hypothetical protein BIV16_10800 [Roseburia sp. 831b]
MSTYRKFDEYSDNDEKLEKHSSHSLVLSIITDVVVYAGVVNVAK